MPQIQDYLVITHDLLQARESHREKHFWYVTKCVPGTSFTYLFFLDWKGDLSTSRRGMLLSLTLLVCHLSLAATSGPKQRVVFLGTPEVAARSLEIILAAARAGEAGGFEVIAAVSQPPARSGRKKALTASPVHALAEAEGIRLFTPPNAKDEQFLTELEARSYLFGPHFLKNARHVFPMFDHASHVVPI